MALLQSLSVILLIQSQEQIVHNSAEELVKHDPYGALMAIMSILIVMLVLSCLYLIFKYVSLLYRTDFRRKSTTSTATTANEAEEQSGEVNAAIAVALHLYAKEAHDLENTVLTIKRVNSRYSPWSSKIYGLRNWRR